MASIILNKTTKLSKRLNKDTKYPWKPKLYILSNISNVNSTTKNKLATSEKEKKEKIHFSFKVHNQNNDLPREQYEKKTFYE